MLDMLVDENPKSRSRKVAVLHDDIHGFYHASAIRAAFGPSASGVFGTPEMVATMGRLYGSAKEYPKKYRKFALWSVLFSTLVEWHKHWTSAPSADSKVTLPWTPPSHWRKPSQVKRVHLFEEQLKMRWGSTLEFLIGTPISEIIWWHIIEVMNLKMACEELPKVSIVEYDLDTMMLYPWDKHESNKHSLGTPEDVPTVEAIEGEFARMIKMAKEMKLSEKEFDDGVKKVFPPVTVVVPLFPDPE